MDLAFATNRKGSLTTVNLGWRLENIVLIELLRRINRQYQSIFYIKKNNQFEVDFVVCEKNTALELIQVTHHIEGADTKLYNREVGGLVKGAALSNCHNLKLIVLEGDRSTIRQGGETIEVIPASDWLCNQERY